MAQFKHFLLLQYSFFNCNNDCASKAFLAFNPKLENLSKIEFFSAGIVVRKLIICSGFSFPILLKLHLSQSS